VKGHGGLAPGVADAVDVGRAEGERLAGGDRARRGRAPEHEPLLADLAGGDGDGPGRQVVVVVAGVVVVHPADQPDGDALVAVQLGVGARVGPVLDQVRPLLGPGSKGRGRAARAPPAKGPAY
jgi:hypothetical protein